jgi:hypothetical protein
VIIGVISIGLSMLNVSGTFLHLAYLNDFVRLILPFQSILVSIFAIVGMILGLGNFANAIISPFISYVFSIILVISGIGTIWVKPWGKMFAKIYAFGMIILLGIGLPIILTGYIKSFITHDDFWFIDALIVWGGALAYVLAIIGGLSYPIILLVFFSRPKIKEIFSSNK